MTRSAVVPAGLGLCASIVLPACGGHKHPSMIGPELGSTHVAQGPSDPTAPPPDAPDYDEPSPGYEITPPSGPAPIPPAPTPSAASEAPPDAQPGVFSPPPPNP